MKHTLLLLSFLSINILYAQGSLESTFQYSFGGTNEDALWRTFTTEDAIIAVIKTKSSDGDITGLHGSGTSDIMFIKVSLADGQILWKSRAMGGSGNELLFGPFINFIETSDKNYVFGTSTPSTDGDVFGAAGGASNEDLWIFKINSVTGDPIWFSEALGGTRLERWTNIAEDPNGDIIVQANTLSDDGDITGKSSAGFGDSDNWLIKINGATGSTIWKSEALGGSGFEYPANYILFDNTGNIICVGTTTSSDGDLSGLGFHGGSDIWLVKVNVSNGNIIWKSNALGGSGAESAGKTFITSDGNIIVFANTTSPDGDITGYIDGIFKDNIWVFKVNSSTGTLMDNHRMIGGSKRDNISNVFQIDADRFIMVCQTNSGDGDITNGAQVDSVEQDIWFVEFDANAWDITWTSDALGGSSGEGVMKSEFKDSFIYVIGNTTSIDGDIKGGTVELGASTNWMVFKLNINSKDILISESLGGNMNEEFYNYSFDCFGGILLCGDTYTVDASGDITRPALTNIQESLWMVKLNNQLEIQWDKLWTDSMPGNTHLENGYGFGLQDGGYILFGQTYQDQMTGDKTVTSHNASATNPDIWITKFYWNYDVALTPFFNDTLIPFGDTLCLSSMIDFKYMSDVNIFDEINWDFGDGNTSQLDNPVYYYSTPGTYHVILKLGRNCLAFDTLDYTLTFEGIRIDLGNDTTICEQFFTMVLDAGNPDAQHQWNTGETTQTILVSDIGKYFVTSMDINVPECITSDSLLISDDDCKEDSSEVSDSIYIPNGFSPNSDGIADHFKILGLNNENINLEISIYDKFGSKIFSESGNHLSTYWDGTNKNGQPAKQGIYIYSIIMNNKKYIGNVTLIR